MPTRKSAIKALRQNRTRHLHNLDIKTDLRKTIKNLLVSIQAKKVDEAKAKLKTVFKRLDKAAKKKVLSKNTVSRRKSRFMRLLNSLA